MNLDLDTSTSLILQQNITGTGVFNGTEVGRATVTHGAGNAAVTFKARRMGTDFNGYKAKLVNPGLANPLEIVRWDANTNTLEVTLRYAAGAITSTAATVAAAVQAAGRIVTAAFGGTGASLVTAASVTLAGAIDPTVFRNMRHVFAPAANVNGGRLTFDQTGNILVRQVEATLGASVAWTLELVNLDEGLTEIAADTVLYSGATSAAIMLTNVNLVLSPLRALKFTAATTGVIRVVAHKEPNFPNA